MSKGFRIFEAPSCAEGCLPIDPSPWFTNRDAWVPLGHWELLIDRIENGTVFTDIVEDIPDRVYINAKRK